MAKSTRSSARSSPSPAASGTAGPTGKKRGSNPLGVGGTLVTILLAVLLWWLNGGQPTSNTPAPSTDSPPTSTSAEAVTALSPTTVAVAAGDSVTATEAATAVDATTEPAATDEPTPTSAPPTATARPAPTATKPPQPTPAPTSKAKAGPAGMATITHEELLPEALETLALIETDGPFPYERDGITFQNRERLLPSKPRGYYREYTVITPGENDRGARRIIAGENGERYYTDDHYESFYWIIEH